MKVRKERLKKRKERKSEPNEQAGFERTKISTSMTGDDDPIDDDVSK